MKLNPEQRQAVKTNGSRVLVVAGPGTGKTRVMVNRAARLLKEGVSGHNILMLTFTNKAAREMKERLILIAPKREVKKIWIGTFHSIGLRILKEFGGLLGYKKNITVYDDIDQSDILKVVVEEMGLKLSVNKALGFLAKYYSCGKISGDDDFESLLISYKSFLKSNNAMDFGMILIETNKLIKSFPEVQQKFQSLFNHILVDEYQDTDRTQYNLHSIINPDNLFCVGDPDQAIYGWRGASMAIILGFQEQYAQAETIKLEQNYRSAKHIVNASNNLISHNQNRIKKEIWTDRDGEKVNVKRFFDSESLSVLVQNLFDCAYNPKDIAILSRGHALLGDISAELDKASIPHQQPGQDKKLLKTFEVRQLIRILKLTHNLDDNYSCRMIVNWPEQRFSVLDIAGLELKMTKKDSNLCSELKNRSDFFSYLFDMHAACLENFPVGAILNGTAKKLGVEKSSYLVELQEYISGWEEGQEAGQNISVQDFLDHLCTKDMQDDIKERENKVTLLTIHAAKGLEWPVVIVVGTEEGVLPLSRGNIDLEEERRLMYVAITRAQNLLYVTYRSKYMPSWGQKTKTLKQSRFVKECKEEGRS